MRFLPALPLLVAFLTASVSLLALPSSRSVSAAQDKPDKPWRDYPTTVVKDLPGYVPVPAEALSQYGGRLSRRFPATGFFHTIKAADRWWIVDPEGCAFESMGLVDVNVAAGSPTANEALNEKLGGKEKWPNETSELLHGLGFNGTGAWSADKVLAVAAHRLAYTPIFNFMGEYGRHRGGTYQQSGHMGYPKDCIFVFDPEFPGFCEQYAKRLAATKDDPWLLGYFSDNELPFYRKSLDNFLSLPESDPGRKAAEAWMSEHAPEGSRTVTDQLRHAFVGFVAERYLAITTAAIREADPNHMCLGPRFTAQALDEPELFRAAGRHLDVTALNYYHAWTPDPAHLAHWAEWSGKPFMITEWYAKGMDSGYANTSGAGYVVKTQADRGAYYENFTLGLLNCRSCVGWHWFKYMDNDSADMSVDPSNRDSNKGLLNLRFEPYKPLVEAMAEINTHAYSLIDYFDTQGK